MNQEIIEYLNEAIDLELNVAELYLLFYNLFPEDSDFWWKLVIEEKNHASILKNVKMLSGIVDEVPKSLMPVKLEVIKKANASVRTVIGNFRNRATRKNAFKVALEIETSAGELHYQSFIQRKEPGDLFSAFRKLNHEDKDHAVRIQKYIDDNNI